MVVHLEQTGDERPMTSEKTRGKKIQTLSDMIAAGALAATPAVEVAAFPVPHVLTKEKQETIESKRLQRTNETINCEEVCPSDKTVALTVHLAK